jgi:hypothetical protein
MEDLGSLEELDSQYQRESAEDVGIQDRFKYQRADSCTRGWIQVPEGGFKYQRGCIQVPEGINPSTEGVD